MPEKKKRQKKRIKSGVKARRTSRTDSNANVTAEFLANADAVTRRNLGAITDLPTFRSTLSVMSRKDRLRLVDQAIVLLEQNYVHLPLKQAMHAVAPVQRLKLLQARTMQASSEELESEFEFHREILATFHSVRDLHTNYVLPNPFRNFTAFLPFLVELFFQDGERKYILSQLTNGFTSPPFEPGVEIVSWNGIPMARAVELNGDRYAGSNQDARLARGLRTLTNRPLALMLPPDEDRVIIGFTDLDGQPQEVRIPWFVFSPDSVSGGSGSGAGNNLSAELAMGVDMEMDLVNRSRALLFAPQAIRSEHNVLQKFTGADSTVGDFSGEELAELVPDTVISGSALESSHGSFAHIRLRRFSFNVDLNGDGEGDLNGEQIATAIVQRFIALVEELPDDGLIIDVRGNGGGVIFAGERLIQLFCSKTIKPEPLQWINTPTNLRICEKHSPGQFIDLSPWVDSMRESVETGATYSRGFPITTPESANSIGQLFDCPVVVITDALCYSTTDIFAAGVQDHDAAVILGVDGNTGAGGANVWGHDLLSFLFPPTDGDSPYEPLPNKASMRTAIRRTLRVNENAGTPVEDLGVKPDVLHRLTRDDIMNGNVDLLEQAASILGGLPQRRMKVSLGESTDGDRLVLLVTTLGLDRIGVFLDGFPHGNVSVSDGQTELDLGDVEVSEVRLEAFSGTELASVKTMKIE